MIMPYFVTYLGVTALYLVIDYVWLGVVAKNGGFDSGGYSNLDRSAVLYVLYGWDCDFCGEACG